ncbi:MAG: sugar kinase [Chloroflexota bacterium]
MILIVGDLLVDVFVLSTLKTSEQPSGLVLRGGGSAANTAAWLAAVGRSVRFVGCAGNDPPGVMLVSELREQGVDVDASLIDEMETGAVLVRCGASGERVMRSARGANVALTPEMIRDTDEASIEAVHVTGYSLLNRHGLDILAAAAEVARRHEALLSFDPSSVGVVQAVGPRVLLNAISRHSVDILLPNGDEACALVEQRDHDAAAQRLPAVVETALVKLGSLGSIACSQTGVTRVSASAIAPVDTTGAGDAFNGGALDTLVRGSTAADACFRGNLLAGTAIQHVGGRPARHATRSAMSI